MDLSQGQLTWVQEFQTLLGNLSKFIIHQVVELEFNLIDNLPDNLPDCLPDNLIAWLLLLLSMLYRHTHLEDNNSSHTSCSQPFGFWQTGASKVREKHGFFQCFKTVWKPILSQKCFSKEYLPAIFTVSINHSPKHSLFLPPSSCNKTFAVSGHYFYLQRCPHTLGLLIFNYCRFWHSYILKSFSKSIETDNSEWKWTPVVFFFLPSTLLVLGIVFLPWMIWWYYPIRHHNLTPTCKQGPMILSMTQDPWSCPSLWQQL